MKHILSLGLVIGALSANAQEFQAQIREEDPNLSYTIRESGTEAQAVEDCTNCRPNASLAPNNLATVQETADHLEEINNTEWANKCSEFINDGQIGVYGEKIRSEIMRPGQFQNIKNGDSDLAALCPNYPRMNDSSKANVVLLIMTAMAFEESSCNNATTARGPNGVARGFFQLHHGREASYGPECRNYDSNTPEGSITCALSIINKQMAEGPMFRQDGNYWDVLRPRRWSARRKTYFANPSYAQIREAITEFPPCREQSAQQADVNRQIYRVMDQKIFKKKETHSFDI